MMEALRELAWMFFGVGILVSYAMLLGAAVDKPATPHTDDE